MYNNTTVFLDNTTESNGSDIGCGPPPGWTGPPPPGPYQNAANMLMKIIPPFLISLGVFGNALTVIVIFRQMRSLSSTAVFLLALACSDTVFLLSGPLRRWILAVWEKDIRHDSELGCKFSVYLTYCSGQMSSWILVAVTVERFISVVWPHRVRLGCTPRLSVVSVLVLFLLIFGLNTHILYGFGRSDLPRFKSFGHCEALFEDYHTFWTKTYSWIDFGVVYACPFGILAMANSAIIYKLSKIKTKRKSMTADDRSPGNDTRSITITLIFLSVTFFISLTPVSIYFIYRPYLIEENAKWICIDVYEYIRRNEINDFIFVLTNLFGYINASFNFVLYIISGSKYRAEIKALFLCRESGKAGVFGQSYASSTRRTIYSAVSAITKANMKVQNPISDEGGSKHLNEGETGTFKTNL